MCSFKPSCGSPHCSAGRFYCCHLQSKYFGWHVHKYPEAFVQAEPQTVAAAKASPKAGCCSVSRGLQPVVLRS